MKKGYILVRISIHNSELFKEYPLLSGPTMERFGGKYLIRGGKFETFLGKWDFERTVIIKFPSYEIARTWYNSKEYLPVRKIREDNSNGNLIIVDGI